MEKLTQQEEVLMQTIWQLNGGFVRDFLTALEGRVSMPYTTAASVIKNLERKKFVKGRKVSNSIYYRPAVSLNEFRKKSFREIFQNYFKGSYKDLVSSFIKDEHISPDELKELIDLIEKEK